MVSSSRSATSLAEARRVTHATRFASHTSLMTREMASCSSVGLAVGERAREHPVHQPADRVDLGRGRRVGEHERPGHRLGELRIALHALGDPAEDEHQPVVRRCRRAAAASRCARRPARARGPAPTPAGGSWTGSSGTACPARRRPARPRPASARRRSRPWRPATSVASRMRLRRSRWVDEPPSSEEFAPFGVAARVRGAAMMCPRCRRAAHRH